MQLQITANKHEIIGEQHEVVILNFAEQSYYFLRSSFTNIPRLFDLSGIQSIKKSTIHFIYPIPLIVNDFI